MNARWTPDNEILRLRNGTPPDPTRAHKRRFTLRQALVVMAIVLAYVVGRMAGGV